MAINILRPYVLLLIPIFVFFIMYTSKKLKRMYYIRRRLILILKNTVFILLVLAMAGLSIGFDSRNTTTIFVVDSSYSMDSNKSNGEGFISNAMKIKPSKDYAGVISFGKNSQVESFPSRKSELAAMGSELDGSYTNMESGLTSAISLLSNSTKKRIVLVTDGKENIGSCLKLAPTILDMGIDFKVYKIESQYKNEVSLESISLPKKLNMGEEFSIIININSNIKTGAKLTVFNGREVAFEERVELQSGNNKYVFRDRASGGGFRNYRAVIEPDIDSLTKNNEASAYTDIKDKPRVLVIEDKDGEGTEIVNMLKASGVEYRFVNALSAPTTLADMSAYNSIILCNVSAENLREGFLNNIESYVKDFGGGFVATGGDNSFALGGYFKTSLEKILPVNMDMKGKKEIPDMSMMLVIDKSGSMMDGSGGLSKVDIAKEAAARVLDSLRPSRDEIGVIAFDDTVYNVVPRKKIEDPERIRDEIGTIRAGGGTSILPALEEGYNELKKSNAKIKHIILLTDGQAERTGYEELIKKLNEEYITVSTVAVGQSSDKELLESIAKQAKGRFYFTDEFSNIPAIFAKETFMASKSYINNRTFTPNILDNHPILQGVGDNGLPKLSGYIGASPKSSSRVLLSSDEEDPILTVWQYGLGKTAAWNSDINGKWSANYIDWDKNLRFWQNIINWTIERNNNENCSVEAVFEGGKGIISFSEKAAVEELQTIAKITGPNMESKEIKLYPTAPGKYSVSFDAEETGSYMISVIQSRDGEVINAATTGLPVQYSPEYSLESENSGGSSTIDKLISLTDGCYINTPEDVYKGKAKEVSGQIDLTPVFLILSLFLFMMEIALKRLNLPLQKLEAAVVGLRLRLKGKEKKYVMKTIQVNEDKADIPEKKQEEVSIEKTVKPSMTNKNTQQDKLDTSMLLKRKENRYK